MQLWNYFCMTGMKYNLFKQGTDDYRIIGNCGFIDDGTGSHID